MHLWGNNNIAEVKIFLISDAFCFFDIHSPRVPSVEEIVKALNLMLTKIDYFSCCKNFRYV